MSNSRTTFDFQLTDTTLCKTCKGFLKPRSWDGMEVNYQLEDHYPDFSSLKNRVNNGCCLCGAFLKMINKTMQIQKPHDYIPCDKNGFDISLSVINYKDDTIKCSFGLSPQGTPKLGGACLECRDKKSQAWVFTVHIGLFYSQHAGQGDFLVPDWIEEIKEWTTDCKSNHKICIAQKSQFCPERLVAIGDTGNRIWLDTRRNASQYAALSYCWGAGDLEERKYVTTSENLAFRSSQSPLDTTQLPGSIRDAILLAHRLGYDRIWIDSLCIMQNDAKDWHCQAAEMGQIYANADLTIAVEEAKSVYDGFLLPPHQKTVSTVLPFKSSRWSARYGVEEHDGAIWIAQDPINPQACTFDWRQRGWTLQEELLSTRILYCHPSKYSSGTSSYGWQAFKAKGVDFTGTTSGSSNACFSVQCLRKREYSPHWRKDRLQPWLPRIQEPFESFQGNFSEWRQLVQDYKHRSLSFPTDILPAIGGIARKMGVVCKAQYLAGLWCETLGIDLCWHSWPDADSPSSGYLAPSWSWASSSTAIFYHEGLEGSSTKPINARLVEHTLEYAGPDVYGKVTSGHIRLEAKLIPVKSGARGKKRCKLWTCAVEDIKDNSSEGKWRYYGILIEEAPGEETYQRVDTLYGQFDHLLGYRPLGEDADKVDQELDGVLPTVFKLI